MMAVCNSFVGYYISMDVIVALIMTTVFGTARFPSVRVKASSNAFPIYRFPSRGLHPWASAFFDKRSGLSRLLASRWQQACKAGAVRTRCKDTKFLGICIALSKKKYKINFHKACETTFWAKNSRKVSKNLEVKRKTPIFAPTNPARFP